MKEKIAALGKGKIAGIIVVLLALLAVVYFFLAQQASQKAADIFNKNMERQQILAGTVTTEGISADIWGNVYFTNLRWLAPDGKALVNVPQARMKIKPWEVVFSKISVDTIEELELENALLHVGFDDKMRLEVLQHQPTPKPDGTLRKLDEVPLDKRNFKVPEKMPNLKLILKNTVLSATYKQRHFLLNDVNGALTITKHSLLQINLSAGQYGGSIVGNGLNIDGTVELNEPQRVSLNLGLYEAVPASMGLGDIKEPMTITGEMKGLLREPVIEGSVSMKQLTIPGLVFTKLNGNYHYENALITFDKVTGGIYGGTVEAFGLYHFDNHHYNIDAHGKDLMAAAAAKSTKIQCNVELNIKFRNLGRNGNNLVYGDFKSSRGTFMLVPFSSISGEFSNQNKELAFRNVVVKTRMGNIESNAFKIVNGKLQLGNIFLVADSGERIKIR